MLPIETIIPFLSASILLGLAPGPDNIFVLTQSTINGKLAGLIVTIGLCTGLIVHTTAVALGVAIIFQTSTLAFTLLKFIGAAYLVYLAYQALRAKPEQINGTENVITNYRKLYLRGIIMNITNPKVSIFFLAFLPQFADPVRGSISLQLLLLGGLFILATILVFGTIAFLGGVIGQLLNRSSKIQTILNKIAGTVFIGLAIKLATTER